MKKKIEKLFDEFLNGANSPFIKLQFNDKNTFVKKRFNKSTVSRGNIQYLKERVLEIIQEHEPLDEIFIGKKETNLKQEIKKLKCLNEHIRNIYKRDLKKDAPDLNSGSSDEDSLNKGYEVNQK